MIELTREQEEVLAAITDDARREHWRAQFLMQNEMTAEGFDLGIANGVFGGPKPAPVSDVTVAVMKDDISQAVAAMTQSNLLLVWTELRTLRVLLFVAIVLAGLSLIAQVIRFFV